MTIYAANAAYINQIPFIAFHSLAFPVGLDKYHKNNWITEYMKLKFPDIKNISKYEYYFGYSIENK